MKNGKATGPSGVVAEMLKAAPDICCKTIADLMNATIHEGTVPADWNDTIIVSLFKGKGDVLDWSNYRGLKLTDHVLKVIERVVKNSFKKSILQHTGNCICHLSIPKRPLIECLERYCHWYVLLVYRNGWSK